jgi:hypothetical protein
VSEEKPSLQELEIRLKEQEIRLKEAEARAKERDIASSGSWKNPVAVGLFGATLALAGNIIVSVINNRNTQELEHKRTQSTLILEALKTGDTNSACKNLLFFTSLGLLEDNNGTITGACPGNAQGVPSLTPSGPADKIGGYMWMPLRVQAVDSKGPVLGVEVEANLIPSNPPAEEIPPEWEKEIWSDKNYEWIVRHTSSHCLTAKDGMCFLGMAPVGRFVSLLTKKSGYKGERINTVFAGSTIAVVLRTDLRSE